MFGASETEAGEVVVVVVDGRIRGVDGGAAAPFGFARDELIGRPVEVLVLATGSAPRPWLRDAAERDRIEAQLRDASRIKSEFLASMSHELRTPLNAIIGFSDLMVRGKVGELQPAQHEYVGDILTSARHLLQLINDVLDLAKVEAGKLELVVEDIDLARLVGEVRDVVRGLAAAKRQRLDIAIDPALGPVRGDPARLKQVLYNFLSNAIKFTPEHGSITVRACPAGATDLRLEVEDTGIGIAAHDLDKLFHDFQQLDAGIAANHGGTGLGLALTKRIVEAYGGRVEVASEPGRGSTFAAVLPRVLEVGRGG